FAAVADYMKLWFPNVGSWVWIGFFSLTLLVVNAYIITGESNYVLHVATKDLNSFSHFVINTLNKIKGVVSINSKIILQKIIQKPL
ncbi:Lrp/AsnC ligand binding domain-containing protein, partial [Acinetobacter baumannii]|uniref:Lrp/AsnC ligand binding domain-containing protein n=1 Tax=Acinetobacter baumannii TaxID=470 RepID=UPI001CEDDCB8